MADDIKPGIATSWGGRRPGAGRPKGVPNKLTRPIKEAAAHYTPEALQTLVEIMEHGESEQARVAAAKEVLDRGHGKPRQEHEWHDKGITVIVDRSPRLLETHSPVDQPRDHGEGWDAGP